MIIAETAYTLLWLSFGAFAATSYFGAKLRKTEKTLEIEVSKNIALIAKVRNCEEVNNNLRADLLKELERVAELLVRVPQEEVT